MEAAILYIDQQLSGCSPSNVSSIISLLSYKGLGCGRSLTHPVDNQHPRPIPYLYEYKLHVQYVCTYPPHERRKSIVPFLCHRNDTYCMYRILVP
jgi:hypothetical protein